MSDVWVAFGKALNVFGMLLIFGFPIGIFIFHVVNVRRQSRMAELSPAKDIDEVAAKGDGLVEQQQQRRVVDRLLLRRDQRMNRGVHLSTNSIVDSSKALFSHIRLGSKQNSSSAMLAEDGGGYMLHSDAPTTILGNNFVIPKEGEADDDDHEESQEDLSAGSTNGAFVVPMNSQTYLETMHRGTTSIWAPTHHQHHVVIGTLPLIFCIMGGIVVASLLLALYPLQLTSTFARLQPGDLAYFNCSVNVTECIAFEWIVLDGSNHTAHRVAFTSDQLPKAPDVLRIQMNMENTTQKQTPGAYVLGNYRLSVRAEGEAKPIVSQYVNQLVTTCSCVDNQCRDVSCSTIPLVGVNLKRFGASLYDLRRQRYMIELDMDTSESTLMNSTFPAYSLYVELLENPYEMTGLAVQCILGCFNMAYLVHFVYSINAHYVRRHPTAATDVPIPRRWVYHLSLERKLLVMILLALAIANNPFMITLTLPFFGPPGPAYLVFRSVWETVVYVTVLGSLLTIIDAYRKDSKLFKNGASMSILGTRFVLSKLFVVLLLLALRLSMILAMKSSFDETVNIDQWISTVDLALVAVGVTALVGVVVHVHQVLDRQRYSETRYLSLNFRYITAVTYAILAVLLINLVFFSAYAQVSTYKPTALRTSTTVSAVSFSVLICLAAVAFYPPRKPQQGQVPRGYVIREKRQFATTPTGLSPVAGRGTTPPRPTDPTPLRPRDVFFRPPVNNIPLRSMPAFRAKPISTPHHIFCIETACLMYNCSRHAYDRPALYQPTDMDDTGAPLHPPSAYVSSAALFRDNLREVAHIHDPETDTNCLVLQSDRKIIFAFRGTASTTNVKTDLKYALEAVPWTSSTPHPQGESGAGHAHSGFFHAYMSVQKQLHDAMRTLLEEYSVRGLPPDTHVQIYCTGHSLGGALATLASLDFKLTFGHRVIMYNFGSPRVGTHKFARFYNQEIPLAFRLVNEGDIVVGMVQTVSTNCFGQSKKFYRHVGTEVVLDGRVNGDFIVRPTFTEKNLIVEVRRKAARHFLNGYKRNLDAIMDSVLETEARLGELHVQTELEKALYGGLDGRNAEWHLADSIPDPLPLTWLTGTGCGLTTGRFGWMDVDEGLDCCLRIVSHALQANCYPRVECNNVAALLPPELVEGAARGDAIMLEARDEHVFSSKEVAPDHFADAGFHLPASGGRLPV
ncbi:hypothetical protein DYB31_004511 [Aphanomyces astaci]|uniref:Fungal lipase-type domain-containing protein n=1 Tax=Aphanomyces astaci TaxID=112090 RepID=A0A397F9R9_APHAT|nr:hypothetical protein DYB31_004511 [Aphanomyces astaci]